MSMICQGQRQHQEHCQRHRAPTVERSRGANASPAPCPLPLGTVQRHRGLSAISNLKRTVAPRWSVCVVPMLHLPRAIAQS